MPGQVPKNLQNRKIVTLAMHKAKRATRFPAEPSCQGADFYVSIITGTASDSRTCADMA